MRMSDWSSDVCSTDLRPLAGGHAAQLAVIDQLALEARLLVRLRRSGQRRQRLENADAGREAAEAGRGIGDLRLEIGVDIADADPPQRGVGRRDIACRRARRQQGDVVQYLQIGSASCRARVCQYV